MEHHTTTSRAEAERLLGIAEKLLGNRDFNGSKDFAVLAQETEPLLDGPDQILAVAEVLIAAERKINNQHDWYSILQIHQRADDLELIKKQYRRLALLLHPDKNKYPFADSAFRIVADAWAVLSDPTKKPLYDSEFNLFTKVDLFAKKQQGSHQKPQDDISQQKIPVRRSSRGSGGGSGRDTGGGGSNRRAGATGVNTDNANNGTNSGGGGKFWTACPYCYNLFEYPRVYDGCCLRCQNCKRAFTGAEILSMPPMVPGREAYYCIWGFFPMGFGEVKSDDAKRSKVGNGFPNWMPPMFGPGEGQQGNRASPAQAENGPAQPQAEGGGVSGPRPSSSVSQASVTVTTPVTPVTSVAPGSRKRGRPRKYPLVN